MDRTPDREAKKQNIVELKPRMAIKVYEDVGYNQERFPFYITQSAARSLGWGNSFDGFYHLTPAEFPNLDYLKKSRFTSANLYKDFQQPKEKKNKWLFGFNLTCASIWT